MSDDTNDTSNVPTCDNNRVNVEIDFVESLINRDTSIVHSSKIDPILRSSTVTRSLLLQFHRELFILRENIILNSYHRFYFLYMESLKVNSTPDRVLESPFPFPIPVTDSDAFFEESDTSLSHSGNSLPEFESFSDHTEETRSGSTTTHVNYSLPEYDSFLFEIEPDQEGLISIDNSNNTLLELPGFESFHFDPSFPRPPPEPPDVEICLHFEPNAPVIDNFNELNDDQRGSEIDFSQNVEDDDSFTFVIRTFLPFLTYPNVSPLSCSTESEDTIFDPGIST
ncbi:hypothetical protein Tco_1073872 [Tanacetum coccineum]